VSMIELEDVEKSYGSLKVLKGVNFSVEEGEIYGVLGPNGAGKTTLFRTILGLLKQDSGKIFIDGEEHDRSKAIKEKIGYLPADVNFYEDMTARENLRFFADLAEADPDFEELLELTGILEDADRNVSEFSTGMKKRLGIAQSLIKDPKIIIYDEPTTGLDPEGKRKFRKHVEKINREKEKTVIVSSHITTEIEPLCDRFGVLHEGVIQVSGTKQELSSHAGSQLKLQIETGEPVEAVELLEELGIDASAEEEKVEAALEDDRRPEIFQELLEEDIEVRSFDLEEETLETAYLKLTGEA
jgi:ABC-2 type transport system ATP-binding protein